MVLEGEDRTGRTLGINTVACASARVDARKRSQKTSRPAEQENREEQKCSPSIPAAMDKNAARAFLLGPIPQKTRCFSMSWSQLDGLSRLLSSSSFLLGPRFCVQLCRNCSDSATDRDLVIESTFGMHLFISALCRLTDDNHGSWDCRSGSCHCWWRKWDWCGCGRVAEGRRCAACCVGPASSRSDVFRSGPAVPAGRCL